MRPALALAMALAAAVASARRSTAQEFEGAVPAHDGSAALAFLERALPPGAAAARAAACWTQWFGIPGFTTRTAAVAGGLGRARGACGVAATGDPEIGWNSAAVALGLAEPQGGVGVRGAVRRDNDGRGAGALGEGVGAEAGLGAWMCVRPGLALWAAHPQVWVRGAAPPLTRSLESGLQWNTPGWEGWVALRSGSFGRDGSHAAGLGLRGPRWRAWIEARDRPLRGGFGVAVLERRLGAAIRIEAHPTLGETVRVAIEAGGPAP